MLLLVLIEDLHALTSTEIEFLVFIIIAAIVGLVAGLFLGKVIFAPSFKRISSEAEVKATIILKDAELQAENLKNDYLMEAKDQVVKLKMQAETDGNEKKMKLNEWEVKLKQQQNSFNQKENNLNVKNENLEKLIKENNNQKDLFKKQQDILHIKKQDLDKREMNLIQELEKIANLNSAEAKGLILDKIKQEAESKALELQQEILDEAKEKANKEARKIIIQTIQRVAAEQTIENVVSVFPLESDELKGQIIGREGRNIRAIESATGVDLVVDDTPEAIVISSFDPLRRELARLSLQRLVSDGRIHPARIEEVVEKTKRQLEEQVMEIGERTIIELGIHGLHKELVRMVGRMRFRSSYGQNLLMHSRETANLCSLMAAEMGLNVKFAKRAGLLHDIGKVPDEETELSHALLGAKLAEKFGENAQIVNAIGAHHDEIEMTCIISPIIQACDAISGARPGARREIMQQYTQRIKDLENIALEFSGVEKAFAIQAGRELRIIVQPDQVSDANIDTLSLEIAQKIQTNMSYPGQIKVTVIREKRSVNTAR